MDVKLLLTWIRDLGQAKAVVQLFIKTSGKKAADLDWQEQDNFLAAGASFLTFIIDCVVMTAVTTV